MKLNYLLKSVIVGLAVIQLFLFSLISKTKNKTNKTEQIFDNHLPGTLRKKWIFLF